MSGRTKTVVLVLAAATVAAGVALAQGWGPRGGGGGMMGFGGPMAGMGGFGPDDPAAFRMLAERLDLTDGQKEQVESILEEARLEIDSILEEAGSPDGRPRFMELFTAADLTVADLEAAFPATDEVREAIRGVTFGAVVEIHDVLTAEQLEELAAIVEEHAEGCGEGPMTGPGPMGDGMAPCPGCGCGGMPR